MLGPRTEKALANEEAESLMIFLITPARGERKGERAAYEGWLRRGRWLEKSGWEGGTRRRVVRVGEKVAQGG